MDQEDPMMQRSAKQVCSIVATPLPLPRARLRDSEEAGEASPRVGPSEVGVLDAARGRGVKGQGLHGQRLSRLSGVQEDPPIDVGRHAPCEQPPVEHVAHDAADVSDIIGRGVADQHGRGGFERPRHERDDE